MDGVTVCGHHPECRITFSVTLKLIIKHIWIATETRTKRFTVDNHGPLATRAAIKCEELNKSHLSMHETTYQSTLWG